MTRRSPAAPPTPCRPRRLAQALEPRLLFDGAALTTLAEADAPDATAPAPLTANEAVTETTPGTADAGVPASDSAAALAPRELVLIDPTLAEGQALADAARPGVEIRFLDPQQPIADQVLAAVREGAPVESLTLVSHGGPGALVVGGQVTDAAALEASAATWTAIGAHLTDDADIRLYGCDVAAGAIGEAFVAQLATLTGADVAASADSTAGADGDWDLEAVAGTIDTAAPWLSLARTAEALDSPVPVLSAAAEATPLLGGAFEISLTFDNTALTGTGYGPYLDLYVPVTGVDGAGAGVDDGISISAAPTYLGLPVNVTTLTLDASLQFVHPLTGLTVTAPTGFRAGDQVLVVELPFGSFAPDQPAAAIRFSGVVSNLADPNVPLTLKAVSGFRFGADPLDNPGSDPVIVNATPVDLVVTPQAYTIASAFTPPAGLEGNELPPGPNYVGTYRFTITPAAGANVSGLTLEQTLPANFVVTGVSGAASWSQAGTVLTLDAGSFSVPRTIQVQGYVANVFAGSEGSPAPQTLASSYQVTAGTVQTADGRDAPLAVAGAPVAGPSISAEPLAVRETIGGTVVPGGTLTHTLDFRVSDYVGVRNLVLETTLSDGLTFNGAGTVLLTVQGAAVTPSAVTSTYDPVTGRTTVQVTVPGDLLGDLFGGSALGDGAKGGTLVFTSTVNDTYVAPPAGSTPSVDPADPIGAEAEGTASAIVPGTLADGAAVTDDGAASGSVADGAFTLSLYAKDGVVGPVNEIAPGDVVTYKMTYTLPTGDAEDLRLAAYLPGPILAVGDPDADGTPSGWTLGAGTTPAAGVWSATITGGAPSIASTTLLVDTNSNALSFDFGDLTNGADNSPRTLEVYFSLKVTTAAFADGLRLTSVAQKSADATLATPVVAADAAQVILAQPDVAISKGVVSASQGTYTPGGGVTWAATGTEETVAAFTGAITSPGLDASPVDGNLTGADAADLVRFAIVLENTGRHPAFDLTFSDTLPSGFELPASTGNLLQDINLRVARGDGTLLVAGTDYVLTPGAGSTLFTIELLDGANGSLARGTDASGAAVANGSNIVVVTYDLRVVSTIEAGADATDSPAVVVNTATLSRYAGAEGAQDHTAVDRTDTAHTNIRGASVTKQVVATSAAHTTGNDVVIGETVTYRVTITVPEGATSNALLFDNLPAGMVLVGSPTVTLSAGLSATGQVVSTAGGDITVQFATLTNANTNNATAETITIEYTARVDNVVGNQSGTSLRNDADWTSLYDADLNNRVAVTVREPALTITATPNVASADADDVVTFTVVVSNASGYAAFDAALSSVLPTGLAYVAGSLTQTGGLAATSIDTAANTAVWTSFGTGQTATFIFQARVSGSAALGETLAASSRVAWTSLPGADANERTGAGGIDDYVASDPAEVRVAIPKPELTIIATSEAGTAGNGVAVGEVVTYRLVVQVPEGTSYNARLVPQLPAGMQYVADSARIALVSSAGTIASSTFGTAASVSGTSAAGITPTYEIDPVNGPFGSGTDPVFRLGDVTNPDRNDGNPEFVILEFQALILNESRNQEGASRNVTVDVRADPDGSGPAAVASQAMSNAVGVTVREPVVSDLEKRVVSSDGSQVTYALSFSNTGRSPAFNLALTDPLTGLDDASLVPGALVVSNGATTRTLVLGTDYTLTQTAGQLDIRFLTPIAVGDRVSFQYTAALATGAAAAPIASTATLTYTSLSGIDANERTGAGGINDYRDSDGTGLSVLQGSAWEEIRRDGAQGSGEADLSGLAVSLIGAGADGVLGTADDATVQTTTTDANGDYRFGAVAAGSYRIVVTPPAGYAPVYDTQGAQTDARIQVTVTESAATLSNLDFGLLGPNDAPTLAGLSPVNATEQTPVAIAAAALAADPELDAIGNYAGATLTVERAGGASPDDRFGATGTVSLSGGQVSVGGVVVGSYTEGGGRLSILFNASATPDRVDTVLQSLTYTHAGDAPPASVGLAITLNDGNAAVNGPQGSGGAKSVTQTVTVNIAPVNDPPVGLPDTGLTNEDTPITFAPGVLLGNDSDPDGDGLAISAVTQGAHGTVTLNPDGSVTYVPNANFTGADTFSYTVSDGNGGTSTTTVTVTVLPANDLPTAVGSTVTTAEDTPLNLGTAIAGNPAFGFSDVDAGDSLQAVLIETLPGQGALTLNGVAVAAGQIIAATDLANLRFTPDPDESGDGYARFDFRVSDGQGFSANSATVTIDVTPVNDPPAARPDVQFLDAETDPPDLDGNLLANDSDPEGGALAVTEVSYGGNSYPVTPGSPAVVTTPFGTMTVYADGRTAFVGDNAAIDALPDEATSLLEFGYTVRDPQGATDRSTLTLEIKGANQPPAGADATRVINEEATYAFVPSDFGFADVDAGDALQAVRIDTLPAAGELLLGGVPVLAGQVIPVGELASLSFRPAPDGNGVDYASFAFSVSDGQAFDPAPNTFRFDVTPQNDPPVGADDVAVTPEDTPVTIDVLPNDSDVDGDPLTVTAASVPPAQGTVTIVDGKLVFTPAADFTGNATITYTISDGNGGTDTATVTVEVTPVNDAPAVGNSVVTTAEDTPRLFLPADFAGYTDVEGDALAAIRIDSLPDRGTLTFLGVPVGPGDVIPIAAIGDLSYTPPADAYGSALTTFQFSAGDGIAFSAPATMTVNVTPLQDPPVGIDDLYGTAEDTALVIPATGVLANDGDVDGDPLTVASYTPPANGSVTVNADGSFTYVPNADFNGVDTFTYVVSDGQGGTDTVTVTINVTPVNDAPTLPDRAVTTPEDVPYGFTAADFAGLVDADGDSLQAIRIDAPPARGVLLLGGAPVGAGDVIPVDQLGLLTWVPPPNENGADFTSFRVSAYDGVAFAAASTTVTVNVTPVNDPPVGQNQAVTTPEDTPISGAVSATDPDAGDSLTFSLLGGPAFGRVAVSTDGSYTYTPDPDYNGPDRFTVRVADGKGGIDTIVVDVTVTPVNDVPTLGGDLTDTVTEDVTLAATGQVTSDDVDPGEALVIPAAVDGNYGRFAVLADGTWTYSLDNADPAVQALKAGETRTEVFTVTSLDGTAGATVTVTLVGTNDPPVARPDDATTAEDTPLVIGAGALLADDSDLDGDALRVVAVSPTSANGGRLALNADGTVTYVPAANFNGVDTFSYTIGDGNGGFATTTVTVTVTPVNDPPVAAPDDGGVSREGQGKTYAPAQLTGNDSDVDGDPLTIAAVSPTSANGGTVTLGADGTVTYVPRPGFSGIDTFTYTLSDGRGGFSAATVTVTVQADPYVPPSSSTDAEDAEPFVIDQLRLGYPDFLQPFDPALFVLPAVKEAFAIGSQAIDAMTNLGVSYAGELGSTLLARYESLTPGQIVMRQGVADARELAQHAAARSGALLNTILPGAQTLFDDLSPFGPNPATGEEVESAPAEPPAEPAPSGPRQTEAPRGAKGFSEQLRAAAQAKFQRVA